MSILDIDTGLAAALIQEIRKLEDAADILNNEKKELDNDPNKKLVLELAIKFIRELSDKKIMIIIKMAEEHGRLSGLPKVSKGNEAEVSTETKPAITSGEGTAATL